jgi:hypothetical protein
LAPEDPFPAAVVVAGAPHVFQNLAGALDKAGEALDRAALFLAVRLGVFARLGRQPTGVAP